MPAPRTEVAIRRRAEAQERVLRHADLVELGLGRGAIAHRLENGRLVRLHRGVYALGDALVSPKGRWLAAQWAVPGSALSHDSAAAALGLLVEDDGAPVHLSVTGTARSRPGIVVHRVGTLEADVFRRGPLRVTTEPRTLVDLADRLAYDELRAVADRVRRLSPAKVRDVQRRCPNRLGAPKVRRLVDAYDTHTKSEMERRFLRQLRRHGLPRPTALNVRLAGCTVDVLYAPERLVVELDGRAFHRRERQMARDRERDAAVLIAGHKPLRLLWDDLHDAAMPHTAARLLALLAA